MKDLSQMGLGRFVVFVLEGEIQIFRLFLQIQINMKGEFGFEIKN